MKTETIDDGGPAFPGQMPTGYDPRSGNFNEGTTLRDWFAGHATEYDIAFYKSEAWSKLGTEITREQSRYRYADAMISARKGAKP